MLLRALSASGARNARYAPPPTPPSAVLIFAAHNRGSFAITRMPNFYLPQSEAPGNWLQTTAIAWKWGTQEDHASVGTKQPKTMMACNRAVWRLKATHGTGQMRHAGRAWPIANRIRRSPLLNGLMSALGIAPSLVLGCTAKA